MESASTGRVRLAAIGLALVTVTACGGAPAATPQSLPTSVQPAPVTTTPVTTNPGTTTPPVTTTPPTTTPAPATSTAPSGAPVTPAAPEPLHRGAAGPEVLALQQQLTALGYWLGTADSTFGSLTTQAVLALQGAAGLHRDGVVGPDTQAALEAGTRPEAHSTSGAVTEIDRDAGLVSFVRDGQVELVLHTSTGTFDTYTHDGEQFQADTPDGEFTVTWTHDGWREGDLGRLYRPRYFHPDGIAVHGYGSVPAYPASHGCARVTTEAMDMIWRDDLMPLHSEVWVF